MIFEGVTPTLGQTLWLLSPELALLLTGLLILGLDATRPAQAKKPGLPYVALAGLAAALTAVITLWGCNTRVLSVLSCDPFALTLTLVTLGATAISILASAAPVRTRSLRQGELYALLIFAALAICLLSGATSLITIFLAFELLHLTSCLLTGYWRDDPHAAEAATKSFLYGAALSAVMLYGMSWLYGLTGSADLDGIAAALRETEGTLRPTVLPALILVMAGFAFRIGAVPFHQWVPDVYEGAPTPITAFLSVGPTIGGFAVIVRALLTALPTDLANLAMDWRTLLMAIATLTMTVGNLVALWQQNIKRLLAYSSIAQAGYMLIGVVAASPRGVTATLLHLVAYVLANLGAFAVAIAFSNQTGSDAIEDYAGLSKRAPALALALLVCLLSLGGVPLTVGFMGKLYLFSAAIEKGLLWLAAVGVTNSVISMAGYWKLIHAMYIAPARTDERLPTSPALAMALGVTAAGVLAFGILPGPLLALVQAAAQTFFGAG